MRLANTYKALRKGTVDLSDALEFLLGVYPICNDGRALDEAIALKALQSEYMSHILSHYLNEVDSNPLKFGLEITRLYSKEGKILTVFVKDIIQHKTKS